MTKSILIALLISVCVSTQAQMKRTLYPSVNVLGYDMRWIEYTPKIPSTSYLIIYPGRGETGPAGGAELTKVENVNTYARLAKEGTEFPFNIIIVQVSNSFQTVSKFLPVYLYVFKGARKLAFHGLSLGAQGIYNASLTPDWAQLPKGYITFLAPISGRPDDSNAPNVACTMIDVPAYAAHGTSDPIVPFSADERFVKAVNLCQDRNKIIWNPVAGGLHNTWNYEFRKDANATVWILTHRYLQEEPPLVDRYEQGVIDGRNQAVEAIMNLH